MPMNLFEKALKKADNVIFETFGNVDVKTVDGSKIKYRGILDTPLSIKKIMHKSAEISDNDYILSMRTNDVIKANIKKRTDLHILSDSGDEFFLYVIANPENDGSGISEIHLGVQNVTKRVHIRY